MSISSFPFGFEQDGVYMNANCTVIDLPEHYEYPIYRVALNTDTVKPDVYLFYKTGDKNHPFFWYKTLELKQKKRWEIISKELAKLP